MASSSGIIDTVSVEWLIDRMGSNRRWSSDSLSLVLDYTLLSKLIMLWPSLPSTGSQLVIKHRLLLALLTIKTPFPEATLAAARSLVATALNDQTSDGQVNIEKDIRIFNLSFSDFFHVARRQEEIYPPSVHRLLRLFR